MDRKTSARRDKRQLFVWDNVTGFVPAVNLADYGSAYRNAAKSVYAAIQHQQGELDAHSLAFLYRHATEAYLKAILLDFGGVIGMKPDNVREYGHRLCPLLAVVARVASEVAKRGLSNESINVICSFHDADPGSVRFRYGSAHDHSKAFNLAKFVSRIETALDELSALYAYMAGEMYREIEERVMGPAQAD
jgi:hypothetical protein